MAADALRAELMAVPGVASAEVDVGETDNPAGVRVRLTPDADARRVGADVQRVLATHGMRSRFSEPDTAPAVPASPPPIPAPDTPPPPVEAPPVAEAPPAPEMPPPAPVAPVVPMAPVPDPPEEAPPQRVIAGGLQSVAVEERADGLGVIVTLDDGRTGSTRLAEREGSSLDAAVITAVAAAVDMTAETVATEWMEVDGGSVVTVVLRLDDGTLVAGAGVVRVGRAYAVGMAARAALEV